MKGWITRLMRQIRFVIRKFFCKSIIVIFTLRRITMLISATDIQAAADRIRAYLAPTPTIHSPYYSEKTSANVYLKLEIFQPTHSFKVRGALNAVLMLPEAQRQKGV